MGGGGGSLHPTWPLLPQRCGCPRGWGGGSQGETSCGCGCVGCAEPRRQRRAKGLRAAGPRRGRAVPPRRRGRSSASAAARRAVPRRWDGGGRGRCPPPPLGRPRCEDGEGGGAGRCAAGVVVVAAAAAGVPRRRPLARLFSQRCERVQPSPALLQPGRGHPYLRHRHLRRGGGGHR